MFASSHNTKTMIYMLTFFSVSVAIPNSFFTRLTPPSYKQIAIYESKSQWQRGDNLIFVDVNNPWPFINARLGFDYGLHPLFGIVAPGTALRILPEPDFSGTIELTFRFAF